MGQHSRENIATACRILAQTGLAELFTGHVSARSGPDSLFVPAHLHEDGKGVESIRLENVIEVTNSGEVIDGGPADPPDELIIHTAILDAREDLNSVVHAHPLHATALSIAGKEVTPHSLDAALLDGDVPLYDPGPRLLYNDADGAGLVDSLGDNNAVLLRGHGAVTAGESVPEATARMWFLERAARLQILSSMAGGAVPFEDPADTETFLGEAPEDFLESSFHYLRRTYL